MHLCKGCHKNPQWIKKHQLCQTCYMKRYMRERRGSFNKRFQKRPRLCGQSMQQQVRGVLGDRCDLCELEGKQHRLHLLSSLWFGYQERTLWRLAAADPEAPKHFQLLCERCIRSLQESTNEHA